MEGLEIGVLNIKCFQHAYSKFVKPYQTAISNTKIFWSETAISNTKIFLYFQHAYSESANVNTLSVHFAHLHVASDPYGPHVCQ